MNNQQDNESSNIDTTDAYSASVGNKLRKAREQLGLSVNDVANRIKFAPKQIEWLEADDFERLPEAAFVRGFVRSYARLVELDSASLLASLPTSHAQTAAAPEFKSVEIAMPSALSARRHNIVWLAAALVVALSLAIFERMQDRSPAKTEGASRTVIQPLELPTAGTESEALVVAEQAQKSETALTVTGQKPQAEPAIPAPQMAINQPVQVAPPQPAIVKQAVGTTPAIAPVPVPVVAPKPVPVPVPAPAPKPAPLPEPVSKPASTSKPAPATAVVPKPADSEVEPPKAESSFSFSNFFKRNATPAAVSEQPQADLKTASSSEAPVKVHGETSASDHSLRLEFAEDAWVEIKDDTGKVLISKMHSAGSLVRVASKSPLDVTIGNAKAVRLFDKGKKINLERYTTAEVARIKLK